MVEMLYSLYHYLGYCNLEDDNGEIEPDPQTVKQRHLRQIKDSKKIKLKPIIDAPPKLERTDTFDMLPDVKRSNPIDIPKAKKRSKRFH
jgi:hypothetical protein